MMAIRAVGVHGALTPALHKPSCRWHKSKLSASGPAVSDSLHCKSVTLRAGGQSQTGGVIWTNRHSGARKRQHCKAHRLCSQKSFCSYSCGTNTITASVVEQPACTQKSTGGFSPEQFSEDSRRHEKPHWLQSTSRRELILISCITPLIAPSVLQPDLAIASTDLQSDSTTPSVDLRKAEPQQVQLVISDGCDLGVSVYPDFEYNAGGKGGVGTARRESDGRIFVRFDPATLQIPPVQFSTTKFLTLPLPPPLKIEIVSKKLEGYIEPETGKVELDFLAEFLFTIGPLYKAKPLIVGTTLTTESSQGPLRSGQGQRLDRGGRCILAGVARVVPVDDPLLDPFLMLPTDCLARLPAQFIFTNQA